MTDLTAVTGDYGHTAAVKDGTFAPDGFTLRFEDHPVIVKAFRAMVRSLRFDVCEMAFTTYLCAREHGVAFTALPVFLVRGFHHRAILYNTRSGIRWPKDLEGRRVGVNRGYTVTTGVWARGILQDEYDVDLDQVTWVRSGDEHVATYRPPDNVTSMRPGADLMAMLSAGELDAAVGLDVDAPDVAHLIRRPDEAALDAFWRRGLYPINHLLVVRDAVLAAHPHLAVALFEAYAKAKRPYLQTLAAGALASPTANDRRYQRVMAASPTGDPLPYGIAPNRQMIDLLIDHAVRQRIIQRRPEPEEIFAKSTWELVG